MVERQLRGEKSVFLQVSGPYNRTLRRFLWNNSLFSYQTSTSLQKRSRIGLHVYTHNGGQFVQSNMCVGLSSELRSLGHFPGSQIVNSLYSTAFQLFMSQIFSALNTQTCRYGHIHRGRRETKFSSHHKNFPCVSIKRAFCYVNGETC